MARRTDELVVRPIRALFNLGVVGELSDGQLLERFATAGGESAELAFAALVERHGPMVLRICRNGLRDPNDVEDAFQATFLVLVRRARALWVEDSLAPWLHRVARRIAVRARTGAARRRDRERRAAEARPATVPGGEHDDGLMALLHEEIDRLPERCRVPMVLCDLEGMTHEQAARRLSWPVGTVKSRLMSGRERLRARLVRRGVAPAVALTTATLAAPARSAFAVVPANLVEATARAARQIAAGAGATTAGVVPASVALLMKGARSAMFMTRIKVFFLTCGLIAGGAVVAAQQAGRPGETATPRRADTRAAAVAAPAAGAEDEAAAVAGEIAELEFGLLQDEVALLRQQVGDALKNKVVYETNPARQDPRTGDDIQRAYMIARDAYLQRARDLAAQRLRTGPPGRLLRGAPGATTKAAPGTDGVKDHPPSASGSQAAAAAVGSIDLDAVFKRYEKASRAQARIDALREERRAQEARFDADDKELLARVNRAAPGSSQRADLDRRYEDLAKRIRDERQAAKEDIERRRTGLMATLNQEISEVIAAVARTKGLDYVVKVEAGPRPGASEHELDAALDRPVLYANPRNDITEEVIGELNRRFAAAGDKTPRY
jgi:RNA polymerase sigma factor (sigma-70 family)